jgi:outer membrane cobalamin receptor
MPPKARTTTSSSKKWGQADRDLLVGLTNRQLIDITDTSQQDIEQVRDLHFRHRDKKNFRKNFRNYSAAWDLEIEYSGARRTEGEGKMRRLILLIFLPARVL